jgi:hypothetical protein
LVATVLWSDKAFTIYMGNAGNEPLTPADHAGAYDAPIQRMDAGATDPCSHGHAERGGWLSRAGSSLTDTQLHSAVRG